MGDNVHPYTGGGGPYWQTGVEDALEGWALHNNCSSDSISRPYPLDNRAELSCFKFGCQSQREVVLVRSEYGFHAWLPGYSRKILTFFKRHQLPSSSPCSFCDVLVG